MDPLDFEEWRRQQAAKLEAAAMTPTDPTAGLPQAFAADRADRSSREALQGLNNSTSLLLGRQPFKVADPSGDAVKEWVMSRKAQPGAGKPPDMDDSPAPPEWGALSGMTRAEALRAGYGRPPKSADPFNAPTPDQIARGKAAGVVPAPGEDAVHFEGSIRAAENSRAGRGAAAETAKATGGAYRDLDDLRKEVNDLTETKAVKTLRRAYQNILQTSDSGAGDMSMVYSYVKMLDEGSVVREAEVALAADAGSLAQKAEGWISKMRSGEKMPPEVRAQFRKEAQIIMETAKRLYGEAVKPYAGIAQQRGYDPKQVIVLDPESDSMSKGPAPSSPGGTVRKTLNGKTYEKRDGKWFEVN